MTLMGVKGLEDYLSQSPYLQARHIDITGVSEELRQNDVFLDTIAQLEMDYSSYTSWGPEVRLLMCVGGAMYNVASVNMASKLTQQMSADALEALNNPQPAAEGPKPVIPGRKGAAAEEMDIPMPADPVA